MGQKKEGVKYLVALKNLNIKNTGRFEVSEDSFKLFLVSIWQNSPKKMQGHESGLPNYLTIYLVKVNLSTKISQQLKFLL